MADTKDALEARRWFRQHLAEIGRQYPHLKWPKNQERLAEALEHQQEHQQEEQQSCPDNPPGDHEDGQ